MYLRTFYECRWICAYYNPFQQSSYWIFFKIFAKADFTVIYIFGCHAFSDERLVNQIFCCDKRTQTFSIYFKAKAETIETFSVLDHYKLLSYILFNIYYFIQIISNVQFDRIHWKLEKSIYYIYGNSILYSCLLYFII